MDQEQIVSLDSSNHELSWYELAEMQYKIALNGRPNYYKASLNNLMKDLDA